MTLSLGAQSILIFCFFFFFAAFGRKEVENVVSSSSSNIWWRGRSYAASVAPAIPDPDKDRKTVPIEARRAMVESFVDKYFLRYSLNCLLVLIECSSLSFNLLFMNRINALLIFHEPDQSSTPVGCLSSNS